MTARVILAPRKAKPFWFGEPWVFDGSVDRVRGRCADGDIVEVRDEQGRLIGSGFYNSRSRIRVRMMCLGEAEVDESVVRERVRKAISLRRETLRLDDLTTAYRVIHAEGDRLPGLVCDRIGDCLVVQVDVLGMRRFLDVIVSELIEAYAPRAILERVSRIAREQEGIEAEEGPLHGETPTEPIEVVEHGVRQLADPARGQKTGFYSDQRDNRLAFSQWVRGRRVLDAFSYTGSFGFTSIIKGGASGAVAVDSSKPALALLEQAAALNGLDNVEIRQGNVLRVLDHMKKDNERFSAVVLDPPKLVPTRSDLRKGLKLYREVNAKGLSVCEDGAIFATSSCSQAVDDPTFSDMVADAAHDAQRRLQLLWIGSQGPDHPAIVPHVASRYLKFHVYRVESE